MENVIWDWKWEGEKLSPKVNENRYSEMGLKKKEKYENDKWKFMLRKFLMQTKMVEWNFGIIRWEFRRNKSEMRCDSRHFRKVIHVKAHGGCPGKGVQNIWIPRKFCGILNKNYMKYD